jgi:hypothetical protein
MIMRNNLIFLLLFIFFKVNSYCTTESHNNASCISNVYGNEKVIFDSLSIKCIVSEDSCNKVKCKESVDSYVLQNGCKLQMHYNGNTIDIGRDKLIDLYDIKEATDEFVITTVSVDFVGDNYVDLSFFFCQCDTDYLFEYKVRVFDDARITLVKCECLS